MTFTRLAVHLTAGSACAASLVIFLPAPASDVQAVSVQPARVTVFRRLPPADSGFPVRVHIPSINVDAEIKPVTLTTKGAMDMPDSPDIVGWYSLGVRPGENGSAVLAGHLDWYNGKTAVFQNLDTLKKGDLLSIETNKGRFLLFSVREIRSYNPYEYAPDVFAKSDSSHLNIVTCGGVWDPVRKIYSKRIVVFADAVERM